jgi:lipoprotein-anchoring transpeptidase ErfK/SrfK
VRSRSVLVVSLVLVLLLGLSGAVLAYDSGKKDTIAEGVSVGGVDLGGLDESRARERLEAELLPRLKAPIIVNHDRSTWTLGAKEARITTNVGLLVDDAVRRSQSGGILGRTFRNLTGGTVDADLQPQVGFSKDAVVRLLDHVRRGIERPAKDAKLTFTAAGLTEADGQVGLRVKASELHQQIRAAIVSPTLERRFVAQTEKVQPKLTRERLAKKNPVVLIADRASFKLRVYKNLKLDKTYGIAVGAAGNETPAGLYKIANKAINPAWSVPNSDWAGDLAGQVIPGGAPNNPLKSRWLGIYDGVGIHGTSDRASIGSNASHGCLRMLVEDVEDLYPRVPVGAPIFIA